MKRKVSVIDYGAVPNSKELQTEIIQRAIDDCFLSGGGEVCIPEGKYITGGLRLRSDITLRLCKGAILKGSRDPEDYFAYRNDMVEPLDKSQIYIEGGEEPENFLHIPGTRWSNALIRAMFAENVSIIGEPGSVINGMDCYDEDGEEGYRGPHGIGIFRCKNITFDGYTVQDSGNWAHCIFFCENIMMNNVSIFGGHDGMHVRACKNIIIENCKFHTGDDSIAGFADVNMTVKNCELSSACSTMRLGGTNIVIDNCNMFGPCEYYWRGSLSDEDKRNGAHPSRDKHRCNLLSAFTYFADHTFPIEYQQGNIIIKNCRIDHADRMIHYNYSGNELWQTASPLESIRFENVTATDISVPLTAYGDKDMPFTLELKKVDISMRAGCEDIDFMHTAYYKKIVLDNVKINGSNGCIKVWSDGETEITDTVCDNQNNLRIIKAEEEFYSVPI